MVGQSINFLRVESLIWIESLHHLAAVEIKEPLRRDTECAAPKFLLIKLPSNQLPHQPPYQLRVRPDLLVDQRIQRFGRLNHLSSDEFSEPRGSALVEEAPEHCSDEGSKTFFGRDRGRDQFIELRDSTSSGVIEYRRVKLLF